MRVTSGYDHIISANAVMLYSIVWSEYCMFFSDPQVQHTKVDQPVDSCEPQSPASKSSPSSEAMEFPETEGMVFHPVVRGPLKTRQELSRDTNSLRVVSPTQEEEDSSSGGSPVDSLSADSSDAGPAGTKRVVRRHKKIVKKENQKGRSEDNSSNQAQDDTSSKPSGDQVYSESSSEDESALPHLSPPRSRRRRKLPPGLPRDTSNHKKPLGTKKIYEPPGPKIVGILKKRVGTVDTTNQPDGKEGSKALENGINVSAIVSCASSTTGSVVASEQSHCREDTPSGVGPARVSRDTVSISSASTSKRVRFSDNLESSLNFSQASVSLHMTPHPPHSTSSVAPDNNTIEQLWKHILQNSSPSGRPNGMFNPRMRISLSQRGRGYNQEEYQVPSDRITVHVPRAKSQPPEDGIICLSPPALVGDGGGRNTGCKTGSKAAHSSTSGNSGPRQRKTARNGCLATEEDSVSQRPRGRDGEGKYPSPEQSPTDAQIESVWEDIQSQLNGRGEGRTTVAPRVYQFPPAPQNKVPPTGGRGEGRYLPHRPQQKPTRSQGVGQSHTHQKWAGPDKQLHRRHHVTHPDTFQSEPSYMTVQTSSWEPQLKSKKPGKYIAILILLD